MKFPAIKTASTWLSNLIGGEAATRRRRAMKLARVIRAELSRLGFVERLKDGKVRRVEYEPPLLMTQDELWLPIALARFPARRTTNDLRDADVLQSLSDRIHAGVKIDKLANGKLCIVARMRPAQFPTSYSINAFKLAPDAPRLAFPLGINADGEHVHADLADIKHLLVCGATGGGKSTFLHTMLYTWITRCSSDEVELWLIDLKNGAEFGHYEALHSKKKHCIVQRLAYESEDAVEVLARAFEEIQKRNRAMKQHGAGDLAELSHLSGTRYREVVVVIDEVHLLTQDTITKIGKKTVRDFSVYYISKIAALGRAAGVRIVIATQAINKEVLAGPIRANFETRICFSTADWRQSQLIIETSEAVGLTTGRMFYRHIGTTQEHQAPNITRQQRRLEVNRVAQHGPDGGLGTRDELAAFVRDAKLIISIACEQFNGNCAVAKLSQTEGIRGVIPKDILLEHLQRLERDGILEPGSNNKARRVARGYFGMPGLLDARYGQQPDTDEDEDADAAECVPERDGTTAARSGSHRLLPAPQDGQDTGAMLSIPRSAFANSPQNHQAARLIRQIEQVTGDIADIVQARPDLAEDIPAPFRAEFGKPPQRSKRNLFGE
jgi:energy-coupling factor transporter ATP-binding protein EcfA2